MKKIKFSHNYNKLTNAHTNTATLLEVIEVNLKDLSKIFLDYDTDNGKFKLPKSGNYLLLLFKSYYGVFTTLRSAYPQHKVDYYKQSIGDEFEIIIGSS